MLPTGGEWLELWALESLRRAKTELLQGTAPWLASDWALAWPDRMVLRANALGFCDGRTGPGGRCAPPANGRKLAWFIEYFSRLALEPKRF